MINQYLDFLQESKQPDVLYHASGAYSRTLSPKISPIASTEYQKKVEKRKDYKNTKLWSKKAVFAATEPYMCYPFGLERINILWPGLWTEEEVANLNEGCYLSLSQGRGKLVMCYYNCKPTKPLYLYTLDSKDFKMIDDGGKRIVEQWYSTKEIKPIDVKKYRADQLKRYWKVISKKDWELKKQRYRDKGYYK